MVSKIILEEKIEEIAGRPWYPIDVARVNDLVVPLAPHSDITLHQGELAVIPKGVEHCPKSLGDTYILMFEPYVLKLSLIHI